MLKYFRSKGINTEFLKALSRISYNRYEILKINQLLYNFIILIFLCISIKLIDRLWLINYTGHPK